MLYLKELTLKNYCSYDDHTFSFMREDGSPYPYVCFFGPNGVGKCLIGTCYINTYEHGMIPIGDLFKGFQLKPDSWYDLDINIECNGEYLPVHKVYYNGKKSTTRITTLNGYVVDGSSDLHSILVIRDKKKQFVRLNQLEQYDFVCISRQSCFPETSKISVHMSSLLGYLVAEGYVRKSIRFYNTDQDVNDDFCQQFYLEFNSKIQPRSYPSDKCKQLRCTTIPAKYHKHMLSSGLEKQISGDKTVPSSVLSGTRKIVCTFLQSYFEGDGGVETAISSVSCCSKSYQLMHQIHLLLLRLGIVSSLGKKHTPKLSYVDKSYTSWRITIQGADVLKFARNIGFVSSRKKQELDDLLLSMSLTQRNPNRDVIPTDLLVEWSQDVKRSPRDSNVTFSRSEHKNSSTGLHCLQPNYLKTVKLGVSRDKITSCIQTINSKSESKNGSVSCLIKEPEWLTDDYYFDQIQSIEHGEEELFDVCVEDKHCFWSNGFISHNSTLLEAISLLTIPTTGRHPQMVKESLQKYVRNVDYDPTFQRVIDHEHSSVERKMLIRGVFVMDEKEYVVELTHSGMQRNDFAPVSDIGSDMQEIMITARQGPWGDDHIKFRNRICHFVRSDSDLAMHRFQLIESQREKFEEIISEIMRWPVECCSPKSMSTEDKTFCLDYTITKKEHKIHFKRMSAGEKKISKSFSELLNLMYSLSNPMPGEPEMAGWPRLLLFDNIVMHVYYDRHVRMIDCLKQVFKHQQIFATTHSGVLIQRCLQGEHDAESELMIDLEPLNS